MKLLIFLLSVFTFTSFANEDLSHACIHGQVLSNPEIINISSENPFEGRTLQAYQNIRIFFDLTLLSKLPASTQDYLENVIIPPAKNYFEEALKVQPLTQNLTSFSETICSGTVTLSPIYKTTGVAADLVIFVDAVADTTQNYVAYVTPCAISTINKRPVFARLVYNTVKVKPNLNDMQIERDITVTLHEITHALGFSNTLFKFFVDPATNMPLQNHVFKKVVNHQTISVINVDPLTARLRNHFNCPTLEGAYLENENKQEKSGPKQYG